MTTMDRERLADGIDAVLLRALIANPEATNLAIAETTGLARNTVRSRLLRYAEQESLHSFEHRISPAFLGYPLSAYIVTRVQQKKLAAVAEALTEIPEVLEVNGLA